MQRIEIIGNLAKDASLVQGQNGMDSFISMRVVCNEKKGDMDSKVYYDVTSKSGGVFNFLKQGKKIYVSGVPSVRAYQNKEGVATGNILIRAHTVELL